MQSVKLTAATLLAAALAGTAPIPVQAQVQDSPLLRFLLLLKAAPNVRSAGYAPAAEAPSQARVSPSRPEVPTPQRPELMAARGDDGDVLLAPIADDSDTSMRRR